MLTDYLSLGPLIVERLRAQVAGLQMVEQIQSLEAIDERLKARRAGAIVIYDGDRLGDSAGRGRAQIVMQRWLVVLAVRNARAADSGDGARADAGPLLTDILAALQGWAASPDHRPLARVDAPRPEYSPAFAFYPLAFEAALSTLGD